MRIGDQLELVAKLKGQKDKAAASTEVRTLMEDLGIGPPTPSTRADVGRQKQQAASLAPSASEARS